MINRKSSLFQELTEHELKAVLMESLGPGETEPPRLYVAQHHLLQARFVYRNHPAAQFLYLPFVDVDAGDVHPHVGETGSRHEPDIPGSHYG